MDDRSKTDAFKKAAAKNDKTAKLEAPKTGNTNVEVAKNAPAKTVATNVIAAKVAPAKTGPPNTEIVKRAISNNKVAEVKAPKTSAAKIGPAKVAYAKYPTPQPSDSMIMAIEDETASYLAAKVAPFVTRPDVQAAIRMAAEALAEIEAERMIVQPANVTHPDPKAKSDNVKIVPAQTRAAKVEAPRPPAPKVDLARNVTPKVKDTQGTAPRTRVVAFAAAALAAAACTPRKTAAVNVAGVGNVDKNAPVNVAGVGNVDKNAAGAKVNNPVVEAKANNPAATNSLTLKTAVAGHATANEAVAMYLQRKMAGQIQADVSSDINGISSASYINDSLYGAPSSSRNATEGSSPKYIVDYEKLETERIQGRAASNMAVARWIHSSYVQNLLQDAEDRSIPEVRRQINLRNAAVSTKEKSDATVKNKPHLVGPKRSASTAGIVKGPPEPKRVATATVSSLRETPTEKNDDNDMSHINYFLRSYPKFNF